MDLSSERLKYIKLEPSDQENYLSLVTDQDVMKHITYFALTPEKGRLRFEKAIEINNKYPELGYYSVWLKEGSAFLGLVKLIHLTGRQAEVGYMLKPEYWGRHYASEMLAHCVAYAGKLPAVKELIAIVDPENIASIKVLLKCGFYLDRTGLIDNLPAEYYKLVLSRR